MSKYVQDFSWNYLSIESIFNNWKIISLVNLFGKVIKSSFLVLGRIQPIPSPSLSLPLSPHRSLYILPLATVLLQPLDRAEPAVPCPTAAASSHQSGHLFAPFSKLVAGMESSQSPKVSMEILSNFADQSFLFPARILNFPEFFPSMWAWSRAPVPI